MIGTTVGSYRVKQRLGQGGVGSVYRVEHTVLGTQHALKVLTLPNECARKRLLAEGQIQARLRHPNLVAVRDVVDVGGHPGLLLDLVEGPTLARLLASGPLPVAAIGALGAGILKGMARAHAEGLVRRGTVGAWCTATSSRRTCWWRCRTRGSCPRWPTSAWPGTRRRTAA